MHYYWYTRKNPEIHFLSQARKERNIPRALLSTYYFRTHETMSTVILFLIGILLASASILTNALTPQFVFRPDQLDGINKFTSEVDTVLNKCENPQNEFISFCLKGPRAPRKTKKMNDIKRMEVDKKKEELRGKIREVSGRLILLKLKGKKDGRKVGEESLLIQTTVKYHGATDIARNCDLQDVEKELHNFFTSSLGGSEWGDTKETDLPIHSAELKTAGGTWTLDLTSKKPKKNLCNFTKATTSRLQSTPKPLSHDRSKKSLLSSSAPFFQKLGLTDADGKPKVARSSKLRQCKKFVEIVSGLVDKSDLPKANKELRVVDMGCGRGYLTFSLHAYLYHKYDKSSVQSRGVDVRPKLMDEVNNIARDLGKQFDGLQFLTGTISSAPVVDDVDILIALHACDTATDDSLWYGIEKNAQVIVSAPCCHKQIRHYLDAHVAKTRDHPYAEVLRHNIYRERVAETITDSMRALLLEIAGYDVQVFEFIGGEHTSKNVCITAIKRTKHRSESQKRSSIKKLQSLANTHGIKHQKLADLMEVKIEEITESHNNLRVSKKRMPSL